jgi:hypothetical protein
MRSIAVLVLLSFFLLNACSQFPALTYPGLPPALPPPLPPVIDAGRGIHEWLAELHGMQDLTPELLLAALATREQEYAENPTASNRLRFALLLAAGNESIRDYTHARELLANINLLLQDPAEQALATILQQFIDQQQTDNKTISELSKQVKGQRNRIKELEEQQRALTTIEHNIKQREISDEEPQ